MMKIAILEYNAARRAVMQDCLRDRFHSFESVFFDDASEMLGFLKDHLASALIISLDHDLDFKPQPNGEMLDAGTGRQVADFLALHAPVCPVIIHTTNSVAGDGMEFLLRDAHWQTHRVYPWGDLEWISTLWFKTIRNAIVDSARPRQNPDRPVTS